MSLDGIKMQSSEKSVINEVSRCEKCPSKKIEGIYWDEAVNIFTGEKRVLHVAKSNIIVEDYAKVVAAVLKNHPGYSGITFWAVGEGEWTGNAQTSSWDSLTDVQLQAKSTSNRTQLYSEKARVPVSMDFVDASDNVVAGPTNRLEIKATFDSTISGYFREFGLFGGNADGTLGSGLMVDHAVHGLKTINIPSPVEVWNRVLRLTIPSS